MLAMALNLSRTFHSQRITMKDEHVIAHQARRIVELEVTMERHRAGEQQLVALLRNAGIAVTQVELTAGEAEFLHDYRSATPEGKARIRAELEALTAQNRPSQSVDLKPAPPRTRRPAAQHAPLAPGLPAEFFKRTTATDTDEAQEPDLPGPGPT